MLLVLLLGLVLGHYALSVPHSPPGLKDKLQQLAYSIPLSSEAKNRVANVELLISHSSQTHNKRRIYLCISNNGRNFDTNTIFNAAIHELAHVICDDEGHTDNFKTIERRLQAEALKRRYISNVHIDSSYPCI